jgi:hypothetical protein
MLSIVHGSHRPVMCPEATNDLPSLPFCAELHIRVSFAKIGPTGEVRRKLSPYERSFLTFP